MSQFLGIHIGRPVAEGRPYVYFWYTHRYSKYFCSYGIHIVQNLTEYQILGTYVDYIEAEIFYFKLLRT